MKNGQKIWLHATSGFGKLQPEGQIQPHPVFINMILLEKSRVHPIMYLLSMVIFSLRQLS